MIREQIFRSPEIVKDVDRPTKPTILVYDPTAPQYKLLVKWDSHNLTILDGDGIEFALHGRTWHLTEQDGFILIGAQQFSKSEPWEFKLI